VDDLVEGPDFGVEEGRELGVLLPMFVGFPVTLLDFGEATDLEPVGADLVDHWRILL
jgi:hypothetical protein